MHIYQFLIVVGRQGDQLLSNEAGEVTSHLQGMFYRTARMLEAGAATQKCTIYIAAGPCWCSHGKLHRHGHPCCLPWQQPSYTAGPCELQQQQQRQQQQYVLGGPTSCRNIVCAATAKRALQVEYAESGYEAQWHHSKQHSPAVQHGSWPPFHTNLPAPSLSCCQASNLCMYLTASRLS
jgi:hypothetical protein